MSQLNDLNFARSSHAVCLVQNSIYACAGSSDIEEDQKTFERYDIDLNLWDRLPDCHFPALRSVMIPLDDKYIYKFGGTSSAGAVFKDIEYYNIREKEWIIVSDPIVKADPETLRRLQFKYMPMMSGVQINSNSLMVDLFFNTDVRRSGPQQPTVSAKFHLHQTRRHESECKADPPHRTCAETEPVLQVVIHPHTVYRGRQETVRVQ